MTPTNSCLDGETLAAWVDGGLSTNDAARAEAHVSSCPRCQEIAGLIVKTTPAAIADAPWWRRRAAWLVPVSVGVAAAGLLMIAPTDPAPGPVAPPVTAPLESAQQAATPAAAPDTPSVEARPTKTTVAQAKPAQTSAPEAKKERQRDERANIAETVTGAPAASPPAAAVPPATASAAEAARPTATTAVAGRAADQILSRQSLGAAAGKQAVSPDGALHWRITDRGALERSTDNGTSWQAINVGVTATFTTLQAPEPRTAVVTTTDGRSFRTADGGTTWQLIRP